MSDANVRQAYEIINRILYITIASASLDGQPWNSPVYSAFDKDFNFYWASDKNSQHSENLRSNNRTLLVVYDSTVPEGTGEGVYIQATVQELNDEEEVLSALKILDDRVGKTMARDFKDFSGEAVRRVYKATPLKVWVNDDETDESGQFLRDIRTEISLDELKAFL